ncbi:MAG: 30S ribosomal protein S1 [Lachnospiraceae bacterium]|nr:30S ribosomal protein S1 [Lachnospiraceae bacterium]
MEESFEQLMEESFKTVHTGQVVEGKVISVKEDEIILNIGYKSDATVSRGEYTNTPNVDLTKCVKVDDTMNVKILKVDDREGQVIASYKRLAAERSSKVLEEAFNNKTVLKAPVSEVLNGGLIVEIDETRIFIPASLVSDTFEKDLTKYKGQEIEFVLTEFNTKRRRIIGDRKQLVAAQKEEKKAELLSKIKVGDTVEGVVKNVTDFGAFVDIGGVDGLLHISEMSWGRIENPKKVFKSGDNVRAFIKEISGDKIALSMKFADQNPWANADEDFAIGNVITGKVARMTDFGAFIEIVPGVDALLHVSQISKKRIEKPSDVLKIGQEITAQIVDFNYDEKKISLSMRALEEPDEETEVTEAEGTAEEAKEE